MHLQISGATEAISIRYRKAAFQIALECLINFKSEQFIY